MLENQHSRYGALVRTLPPTAGKVFFVIHADNTSTQHLLEEFPVDRDGVPRVYQTVDAAETDELAIQAALDACVSGRNDYVIIMPGDGNDYDLAAALTMSKNDVHLVSLDSLTSGDNRVGCGRSVTLDQKGDYDVIQVTGQNCEISGMYIKPYVDNTILLIGAAAHGLHFHHNVLYAYATGGSGETVVDGSASGAIYCNINNNFVTSAGSGTIGAIMEFAGSMTGTVVRRNYIQIGDGLTATVGIYLRAYKGIAEYNTVTALDGLGADGTVTTAFTVTGGTANHNTANTANTADFTVDGTNAYVGNYCGAINHLT